MNPFSNAHTQNKRSPEKSSFFAKPVPSARERKEEGHVEKAMTVLKARKRKDFRLRWFVCAIFLTGCATTKSGSSINESPHPSQGQEEKEDAFGRSQARSNVATPDLEQQEDRRRDIPTWEDTQAIRRKAEETGDPEAYQALYHDFERMADAEPDRGAFRFNAAVAAERAGDEKSAERNYRRLLSEVPRENKLWGASHRSLIRLYLAQDKPNAAQEVCADWLKKAPDDPDAHNHMAIIEIAAKDYARAEKRLQEVLKRDSRNRGAYRNLARLHHEQGNYQLSLLLAANALKVGEDDAGVRNNMGVTSLALKEEETAIESFQRAITLEEDHLQANLNLGLVALKSGDYELSRTCFERVLRKYPQNVDAKLGLAVALRGQLDYEAAVRIYEEVLAQSENNFKALYNLGIVHGKYLKHFDKSLQSLERCDKIARTPQERKLVQEKINEIKGAQEAYLRAQKEEAERLAREKAEAEARERQLEEKRRAAKEAHDRLQSRIQEVERLIESLSATHSEEELSPIRTALQQSKMVLEMDDADLMGDALEVLNSAAQALTP